MTTRSIAILIDGSYFLKRLPKLVKAEVCDTPEKIAAQVVHLCRNHVKHLTACGNNDWKQHVYRIFYYDSIPYDGKAHHPIANRAIDFAKSDVATKRHALFDCLRKQRKMALRLGKVNKEHDWSIHSSLTKKLVRSRHALNSIPAQPPQPDPQGNYTLSFTAEEFADLSQARELWQSLDASAVYLGLKQKGVDMRIGVDIASLALKKQVDTLVLVAGDSDFVPAAKLARREGIDFVLDPLWQQINSDLFEHIDGLHSGLPKPGQPAKRENPAEPLPADPAQN